MDKEIRTNYFKIIKDNKLSVDFRENVSVFSEKYGGFWSHGKTLEQAIDNWIKQHNKEIKNA